MFRVNLFLARIMHYYKVSLHAMFGDVEIYPLKIIICSVSGPNKAFRSLIYAHKYFFYFFGVSVQ